MTKKESHAKRERRMRPATEAVPALLDAMGGKERRHLCALWTHWNLVMGDMEGLGFPLGHKDATLVIGAEDSMALQELSLRSVEILERANAFMDAAFFERVKVELMQGRRDLATPRPAPPAPALRNTLPPRPAKLGSLRGKLDPSSPVGQCYEAYLALFEKE